MKRFLKKIFFFILFVFVADKFFCFFLENNPKLEADQRLELVLKGKINKEILILGSSRGAEDIIASQITEETRLSSYNLAYPGSDIEFHYFVLQAVLKFNKKPRVIILAIDNPAELMPEKSLNFRFDRLYPLSKYNYINDKLIEKGEHTILSHFLCLGRLSTKSFNLKPKKPSIKNPIMKCGSMPFLSLKSSSDFVFSNEIANYDVHKEKISKRILFNQFEDLCIKNKVNLILCFPPNFGKYNPQLQHRLENISSKKTRFFVYDTVNPMYRNSDYFYDESHLNVKGAKIFTKELSNYIHLNNQMFQK